MNFKKQLSVIGLNLLISLPTYATAVAEKTLDFMPKIESLLKGNVHYSVEILNPSQMDVKYPDLSYLDSLGFTKKSGIKVVIAKSVYAVSKPAGFFDHLNTGDERFLKHTLPKVTVNKLQENHFKIHAGGESPYSYLMDTYFDSDEISTLPNSKVIRAVTQARHMDVISLSASSTLFREFSKFTKYSVGRVLVSSFIPLKEDKTLVVSYTLTAVKDEFAVDKILRSSYRDEAVTVKKLTDSYKAKE